VIEQEGSVVFEAALDEPEAHAALGRFVGTFLGLDKPPLLVEAIGHSFADAQRKSNATNGQYFSLASLAVMEATLDPLRFRANLYLDGVPAWAEMDWIGPLIAEGGNIDEATRSLSESAVRHVGRAGR